MYEDLNLRAWPFQVVPDPESAKIWAGRSTTRAEVKKLLWKMQFSPRSGLRLLWANLGMGKTHTLLHIRHLCLESQGRLLPVYAEFPRQARGFADVYSAIVTAMPLDTLAEEMAGLGRTWPVSLTAHPIFARSPGVMSALQGIRSDDIERRIFATQWLTAQPGLAMRDLRSLGISYRIKTPEDAISALAALSDLAMASNRGACKLVLLLDECQRLGELRPRVLAQVNSGLHGYYNSHPKGIEIILSFSCGREDNVGYFLSPEIRSRADLQSVSLDVFSREEAIEFYRDLLAVHRINQDDRWSFPFSPQAVKVLVDELAQKARLTPRRLMQCADYVLTECLSERMSPDSAEIAPEDVRRVLSHPTLEWMDDG